jgi:predicted metal-dependent hydrolase
MSKFGFDRDEERRLFHEGIRLFNEQSFFEAHDAWEEVWSAVQNRRREQFYRAIIRSAVCLVLLQSGRAVGTRQVFVDCVTTFEGLPPVFMGIDIQRHIERVRHAIEPAMEDLSASAARIDPARLFTIELLYDPFVEARNGEEL